MAFFIYTFTIFLLKNIIVITVNFFDCAIILILEIKLVGLNLTQTGNYVFKVNQNPDLSLEQEKKIQTESDTIEFEPKKELAVKHEICEN